MTYFIIVLICIACCYITYKVTCLKIIKLDKVNNQMFDVHQKHMGYFIR